MATGGWAPAQPAPVVHGYRSAKTRSQVAIGAVIVTNAVLVVLALQAFQLWQLLGEDFIDPDKLDSLAVTNGVVSLLWFVAIVVSAVAVVAWLSRSVDNVPSIGGGTPKFSPRAAIGWWFVPFASYVVPYQVVVDLWRRMAGTAAQQTTEILVAWWMAWVVGNVATTISTYMSSLARDIEDVRTAAVVELVSNIGLVIAGGLLVQIIRETERRAQVRAAHFAPSAQQPIAAPVQPQQPWGAPAPQQPYAAPVQPQQPYGAPAPAQPWGAPAPQPPIAAPVQPQPQPQPPYGAPAPQPPPAAPAAGQQPGWGPPAAPPQAPWGTPPGGGPGRPPGT